MDMENEETYESDDFCQECNGEGVLEDCDWNGPFEVPCPYCSEIGEF